MKKILALLLALSLPMTAYAATKIEDEGTKVVYTNEIDFQGAGVTATKSGSGAVVTIPGAGSATSTVEDDDVSVSTAITNFDFGLGLGAAESPVGEANITIDVSELTTVTAVSGDLMIISDTSDSGNTKKADVADLISGASEWTDTGTVVHPSELTDDVSLGSATLINASKFSIDGDADQVQFSIQGDATQTDSIGIIENSAGTEVINFEKDGDIKAQSIQDIDGPGTNWSVSAAGAAVFGGGVTAALTGNADTATALAANGANAVAGNAILGVDASGAAEGAFDVWTEAENTSAGYDNVSVDSGATTNPDFVSTGDIDFVNTSNTITGNINTNSVDGTHIALGSDAAGDVMYYNGTDYVRLALGTKGQQLTVNEGETALAYGLASKYLPARKASVGTITAGSPVYVVSYNVGGWIEVEVADADGSGTMPAVGLAYDALTNSSTDRVLLSGNAEDIVDTSSWSVGDAVYVSTTAGTLTNVKPAGETALIQKIGIVGRSNAVNGQVVVSGAGRANDTPNLDSGAIFVGNASNYAAAVDMSGEATISNAGAVTLADSVAVSNWNLTTPTITTSLTTSTPTTLSAAELDRLDGLTSPIIDDDKIDTFSELDTIVADKALVNKADGAVWLGTHDFGGADDLEIPNSATPTVDTAGQVALDTTITSHDGLLIYYQGAEVMVVPAIPLADLTTTDGHIIDYNAAGSKFTMDAPAAGGETNSLEVVTTGIASTEIPIGTAADTVVYAALSGDVTMDNGGVVSIAADVVDGAELADTLTLDAQLAMDYDTAATNTVTDVLRITSTSSGTPANNIGTGMEFETETAAGNNEIGVVLEAIAVDTTATSEDFTLSIKQMAAGATAAETLAITSTGNVSAAGSITATSGMDLGTSQALIGTTAMTIGNNGQTIAIDSSDWDISTTGAITGVSFDANGTGNSLSNVDMSADVTGVLPVANGGTNASAASITAFNNITGYTAAGATGTTSTNLVFSTSPTLTTPILAAATLSGDADFNDGVTDSPKAIFTPATGTAWSIFTEDTADDLQIQANTASTETLDIGNAGVGTVDVTIDGALTVTGAASASNLSGTNTGDDDIPEAGDFGAATDLDSNGAVAWGNLAEGELTDQSIITDDIKEGTILSGDLSWDAALVDGDYVTYDSTGTNFNPLSAAEVLTDIGAEGDLSNEAGLYAALSDVTDFVQTTETAAMDFGGATSLEIPNSATPTVSVDGQIALDTTITSHDGLLIYYQGTETMVVPAIPLADLTTTDGHVIDYNAAGSKFTMASPAAGGETNSLEVVTTGIAATEIPIGTAADTAVYAALSGDATMTSGGVVAVVDDSHSHTTTTISGLDVSDDLNLTAGRSLTLTGDDVAADAELYTRTYGIWFEDPTAADDFNSIWANKTANNFTITEIWGESDQTVVFNLQIDDGTPADVNSTDLTAAAGEVEDTTLDGDVTLAAGEELDLKITSVTSAPTWVSIQWTGTWDD